MTGPYKCARCGVVTEAQEQVCKPQELRGKEGYCGTAPEPGAMCSCIEAQIPFVCGSCGRPAEQAELICNPLVVG